MKAVISNPAIGSNRDNHLTTSSVSDHKRNFSFDLFFRWVGEDLEEVSEPGVNIPGNQS